MEQDTDKTIVNKIQMQDQSDNKKQKGFYKRHKIIIWLVILLIVASASLAAVYVNVTSDIPTINTITDYKPPVVTEVYGDNGKVISEFFTQRRIPVTLDQMSKYIPMAFIAAEDSTFYQHGALDYEAILRAAIKDIVAGRIVQGGSTITQQLVKSLLLTPKKTFTRKLKEAILAYRLESHLTKNDILNIYLNQIYLGNGAYGVEAASERYFHKDAKDVDLAEATILAGLPRSPGLYSPTASPKRAKLRQKYVLDRMVEQGDITRAHADIAYNEPVKIYLKNKEADVAPYFIEMLRQALFAEYGQDEVLNRGLKIYTTIDPFMQKAANKAIDAGLERIAKKQGYPGPVNQLNNDKQINDYISEIKNSELAEYPDFYYLLPDIAKDAALPIKYVIKPDKFYHAVVTGFLNNNKGVELNVGGEKGIILTTNMSWAHRFDPDNWYAPITDPHKVLKIGDVVIVKIIKKMKNEYEFSLETMPEVQGALVALDVSTGALKAVVGGYNFEEDQYNRAVQAKRQPGSAFKPIYYTAALEKGYTPASIILDAPVVYQYTTTTAGATESAQALSAPTSWKPRNYDKVFTGPVTLEDAITHSKNNPSIRLLNAIGIHYAINFARRFGITDPLTDDLTLALGSSSLSLYELVSAYDVFPNYGFLVNPYYISRIVDGNGVTITAYTPKIENPLITGDMSSKTLTGENITASDITGSSMTLPANYVIDPARAYVMITMLRNVVEHGTGWRANALGRPAAGKTGTTEDNRDAWFIGFTPNLIAGVWVGFDNNRSLGRAEVGGSAAAPIWLDFMKSAVTEYPNVDFPIPPDVVFTKIDTKTGYLAGPNDPDARFMTFVAGTQPTKTAVQVQTQHGNEFFRYDSGQ
ncbi:MAG: PBP1A family penicillin-binding protein [Deltaproteobacteria bacterium]|nr:PBP1A family penicillin-binding protein [Deltaproteobacteria bacterium]